MTLTTTDGRPFLQTIMLLAMEKHANQVRKYTHEPYVVHLAETVGVYASAVDFNATRIDRDLALALLWAHDLIEDQGLTVEELNMYGHQFGIWVRWLTDTEVGNRSQRFAAKLQRLKAAPGWIQSGKCCDLYSNAKSIFVHDPHFAPAYYVETRAMLSVMDRADPVVCQLLQKVLDDYATLRETRGLPTCEDVVRGTQDIPQGSRWVYYNSSNVNDTNNHRSWIYVRQVDGHHLLTREDAPTVGLRLSQHKFKTRMTKVDREVPPNLLVESPCP